MRNETLRKNKNIITLIFTFFVSAILFYNGKAQGLTVCSNYCNRDLSQPITGIEITSTYDTDSPIPYGKRGPLNTAIPVTDYFDVFYEKNRCPGDIAGPTTCSNEPYPFLKYDMYYPSNNNYNLCKLGAVILFHGGSYDECSDYRNPGIVKLCQAFAKRGFVAFSVEYRVGVLVDNKSGIVSGSDPKVTYTAAQQLLAVYRACQDARGAIRHIIENQSDKIDNSRIFLGGVSAGSVVAMATAYYQKQSRFNAVFPGIPTALGIVEQDFYELANPTYNFLPNIIGVFNCWGGLSLPYSPAYETDPYSFFNVSGFKKIPIISFAGKQDDIFNYKKQYMYFS